MPDLLWEDVADFFDPDVLSVLPDASVAGTSVEDWQEVFDLVRSEGWEWAYQDASRLEAPSELPTALEVFTQTDPANLVTLHVRPIPDLLVIFRPWSTDEILFDVDLHELTDQAAVDVLCDLLKAIGRRLNKAVVMETEGGGRRLLGYEPSVDRVVRLA